MEQFRGHWLSWGRPVLQKVLWGRAGRAGTSQMPGLAGTRQPAEHRMMTAQVKKRCTVDLILTFSWWNCKEGGLQEIILPWWEAMVTSCSRENFVLKQEIKLVVNTIKYWNRFLLEYGFQPRELLAYPSWEIPKIWLDGALNNLIPAFN